MKKVKCENCGWYKYRGTKDEGDHCECSIYNVSNRKDSWIINNRYQIYKDTGVVYDAEKAEDIPQWIFRLRDKYMETFRPLTNYKK